jgi:hypothetical protein
MTKTNLIAALMISLWISTAFCAELVQNDIAPNNDIAHKHSIGSTLCLLKNVFEDKPVYYGQLNFGYRISPKDNLLVEAVTHTYYEPMGSNGDSEDLYPGKVLVAGVGLGYQRFLWKNSFTSVVATPYFQRFYDSDDKKIQDGFQLYVYGAAGYRFEFCKQRWFLEPMVGVAYWPVNTNMPASFEAIENDQPEWNIEPRIKFGYRF